MTIHLPKDLENSIRTEVLSGHFASEDDLVAAAVREYLQRHGTPKAASMEAAPDPLLGLMSDHVELMDQIVEDAMRNREQQPWRLPAGE
jgi:Arc/MetJ-type ribon-helix-helix transcriptional regulator